MLLYLLSEASTKVLFPKYIHPYRNFFSKNVSLSKNVSIWLIRKSVRANGERVKPHFRVTTKVMLDKKKKKNKT